MDGKLEGEDEGYCARGEGDAATSKAAETVKEGTSKAAEVVKSASKMAKETGQKLKETVVGTAEDGVRAMRAKPREVEVG